MSCILQNLIPLLMFRPLRLCMPGDQLRSARILGQRITHLPYIAAIWAYESLHRLWNKYDAKESSWHSSPHGEYQNGHGQSKQAQRFNDRLGKSRKPTLAALGSKSEVSLVRASGVAHAVELTHAHRGTSGNVGTTELSELKRMIAKLSGQVEELTSRLDHQQQLQQE